ncbi:glycosyltransferase [Blastococcus tunisiensis]|uniref:Glycosyltransferase involved in cell wall bisynthesis n=1 Tax=Blastococcus tunisiensis TaxID=1798228 RepID=A0A1I1YFL5_9ACTN|nr:glycosyltransferase [Blastococcus sp. DSM 46838]SFE18377.1 Glycosyltransferase involved in cell wall bisynthesis [Blastococcus sp. DSM 46838]
MLISVQPHLRFGGAERQTVLLANALQRRGNRTAVVLHEKVGGLLPELHPDVPVEELGLDNHLLTPVVARRLRSMLDRRFRDGEKSMVSLHLWGSVLAGALAERRRDDDFTFVYYEDLDPSEHARFIRLGGLKQRLVRRVYRRSDVVVANTERVADAMVRVYGLERRPRVISPAVDLLALRAAAEARAPAAERVRPLKVVTVGSLVPLKGLDVVYAGLLASGLECEWHVVGEGSLGGWLDSLPTDGPVVVRAHGGTPRPYELVRDADLLVHGSHSEALGLVLLEAIGVGVPVVSAAALGPAELAATLGDRPEILSLFPVGQADALAVLLKERAAELDETPSLDEMQRHIARFSIEATADAWTELADEHGCSL